MRRLLTSLLTTTLALVPSVTLAASVTLTNPLGTSDVRTIVGRIISASLSVIGTIALLMFVYGGFLWLTSRGDAKAIDKGKNTMTWAILGIVVIFGAYVIVRTILAGLVSGSVTTS